jgi:hypothetical protein
MQEATYYKKKMVGEPVVTKYHARMQRVLFLLMILVNSCGRTDVRAVGYTCPAYSAIQSGKDINILCYVSSSACVGRDNSVGTATRYGLDGPGIESL